MTQTAAGTDRPRRVTKRRAETRKRLLQAGFAVFAERGLGATTIDQVVEAAGYTKGAFYSNFQSLEELFLAVLEQQAESTLRRLRERLSIEPEHPITSVDDVMAHVLPAIPVDDHWYRMTAEFTAHALRNPPLCEVVNSRNEQIVDALVPVFTSLVERIRLQISDPREFGQELLAVHDGTLPQCLLAPRNPKVRRRRHRLFVLVLNAHTEPAT